MASLYLIRHAECTLNKTPQIIGGRSNHSPLTEVGILQAIALRNRVYKEIRPPYEVYASPAVRTQSTASIAFPDSEIQIVPELQELSQGEWEGKPRSELYTLEVLAEMNRDNWNFKAPGGESQNEVGRRMYSWVEKTLLENPDENCTVVGITHGNAIKCLLRNLMDFDPQMAWRVQIDNTSITQLRYEHNLWWPSRINDSAHILHLGGDALAYAKEYAKYRG